MAVFGYVRSSVAPGVMGPEAQAEHVRSYCRSAGLGEPGVCVDPHLSGGVPLDEREAGRWLTGALRRGDHVVVATLDRLDGSFLGAALVLDSWYRRGITTHILEVEGARGVRLDAGSEHGWAVIEAIVAFAMAERRMIGIRVKESHAWLATDGRRKSRHAPFGTKWEKGKDGATYAVPNPREQAILHQVAELDAQGYSIDQIRRYLAYEWKVFNRNGREFGYEETRRMILRGRRMAFRGAAAPVALAESQEKTA